MKSHKQASPRPRPLKSAFFVLAIGMAAKIMQPRLWPWGLAQPWKNRIEYISVDMENDSLHTKHGKVKKIVERIDEGQERNLKGPETVIFGNDGTMYIMNEEGFLISISDFKDQGDGITVTAKTRVVADLGHGRPLGGKFDNDNTLYIADAHLGLIRLKSPGSGSKVELVASRVLDQGKWTQILYANDVAVGPKTGMIYFTDSTEISSDRVGTRTWDTMYASKTDCIRAAKTGRLLQYDSKEDKVSVLGRDFHFPNGIAVDKDETHIIFGETFTLRMQKFDLKERSLRNAVDGGLTGYPDGLDCAWEGVTAKSNLCYSVMPSAIVPLMKLAMKIPHPFDILFRSFLMSLPKSLAPPLKSYGGVVEFDSESGIVRFIQDPNGEDVGMLTGVTVWNNKLYLGSLSNDYIGVYEL